ncbi:DEAD/DEAH box helicase [Cyanobium sp. Morenito 9A2]|nr:DEAD/DEAH box helicase [Cyanobium sp. Morenito 9A2]
MELDTTLIGPLETNLEATTTSSPTTSSSAETDSESELSAAATGSSPADRAPSSDATSGFASFGFAPELLAALASVGYQQPSPIQAAAIPELMLGRDLVGQAQTGTGKTAAFALPLLARMDLQQRSPQVLVLTPTRELALQVAEAFNSYAINLPHIRVLPIYGGADFRDQIARLKRGVQVVVGTPGRVMDHMRQGTLDLSALKTLVLDEADEMLRMGFIDDVEWVLTQLPEQRQVVLFSATMPSEIRRISHKYLNDPAEVTIRQKGDDASRIRQRYLSVNAPHKLEALSRVLEAETSEGVIIFARTKAITLTVAESLEQKGYDVAVLNGDVPQAQRERTIDRLRSGKVDVLVATDVAARGLDVERISLVINYDIPFDSEAYVHRIGRTGRAGRSGNAILFLTPRERRFLGGLERAVGRPIEPMEVPSNATINQSRLDRLRQKLTTTVQQPSSSEEERALLAEILQRVAQEIEVSPDQLALAALQLAVGAGPLLVHGDENWLRQSSPSPRDRDRSVAGGLDRRGERPARSAGGRFPQRAEVGDGPSEENMDRFRIEVGWRDRVKPGNIVGAIANEAGLAGRSIGRIQIFDTHSTIDLPTGMPEEVFQSLKRLKVMNKELQITRSSV